MVSPLSAAARDVTKPPGGLSFTPSDLLNALGLEGAVAAPLIPASGTEKWRFLSLGEGDWDPATGGALAVRTNFALDDAGRLRSLKTRLLSLSPTGQQTETLLVELGTRVSGQQLKLSQLHVVGRPVAVADRDSVARVLGLLQHVHSEIRNLAMPDIGKALHDFQINGLVGEKLHVPGVALQGGFAFQPVLSGTMAMRDERLHLPRRFLPELLGLGLNQLDPQQEFGMERSKTGFDRQNGGAFRFNATYEETMAAARYDAQIAPHDAKRAQAVPAVAGVTLRYDGDGAAVDRLVLLGDVGAGLSLPERLQRLGVINRINRDLRRRKYPAVPDHLAVFRQPELLDRRLLLATLDDQPQMVIKVYGGHNAREYLPGFGGTIGGNSKGVLSYSLDADGAVQVQGFRVDAGITFSKQGGIQAGAHGSWDRVLPDPGADRAHLRHDLITHLHADHMQEIVDSARCGQQVGRTVHAAAYDCRVLEQFLKKEKVPPELWPTRNPLQGEGWIHLDNGRERTLSAYYATNAVPHSTPVTAFIIAPPPYRADPSGRALNGKVAANPHYWSYATLGDMSFGSYNLPNYQGEKPPDTGFKADFFAKFKDGMVQEYPDLPTALRPRVARIGVAECDPTSVHREGAAPDVVSFQRNFVTLAQDWFPDKGLIMVGLSTAKRQHEGLFRAATHAGRAISGEGAFLENRLTDMNVMGVNPDVMPRDPDGGNINAYLQWYAAKQGLEPVSFHRRTSGAWQEMVRQDPAKTVILATGSQGSEVEQDSVGTQIADGWSRFQLDPKYCRAAYGVDVKRFVVLYAQSAIPGNEDKQLAQLRKTAYDLDMMVGVAVHDGTRFYNLKEPYLARLKTAADEKSLRYSEEPLGGLMLHGFALYPPGHGWKEDWRQGFLPWFKQNQVQMISVQHYPRYESVQILHGLADEIGLGHPAEPLPNHVAWTLEKGKNFKILGAFTPSFILARDNRRFGKYYGGTTEYLHAVFPAAEGGQQDSGLFAANNSVYFSKFGPGDAETMQQEALAPHLRSRRAPEPGMLDDPPDLGVSRALPTRGMSSPLPLRPHPHLKVA